MFWDGINDPVQSRDFVFIDEGRYSPKLALKTLSIFKIKRGGTLKLERDKIICPSVLLMLFSGLPKFSSFNLRLIIKADGIIIERNVNRLINSRAPITEATRSDLLLPRKIKQK